MKKSRYTEEQISYALPQAETGTPVAEVIRRMGVSEQTFHRWKKLYAGLGVGELRRLKLPRGGEPQAHAVGRGPQPRQAHPTGRARNVAASRLTSIAR